MGMELVLRRVGPGGSGVHWTHGIPMKATIYICPHCAWHRSENNSVETLNIGVDVSLNS